MNIFYLAYGQIPGCARVYTVQPGDFCDKISAEQNASTSVSGSKIPIEPTTNLSPNRFQLADANKGVIDAACDNLFPGEVICLGLSGQDCNTVAVVKEGDTCASIASAANIPFATLLANNPNVDANCDNIGIGEVRYNHPRCELER